MSRSIQNLLLEDLNEDIGGWSIQDVPKYKKIYESLRTAILRHPGSDKVQLPIERVLAEHFKVSMITVRQALSLLEQDGLIEKIHGKPARITSRNSSAAKTFRRLGSLSDLLAGVVHRKTVVVDYERATNSFAAAIFKLADGEMMFRLRLKHFTDMRQFGYTEVFFPPKIGEQLSLDDFLDDGRETALHVFRTVERRLGLQVIRTQVTVGSEIDDATRPKTDPVADSLVRMQLVFSSNTGPFQVTTNWFDGRLYEVSYELAI